MSGLLKVRFRQVFRYLIVTAALLVLAVVGVRMLLLFSIDNDYDKDKVIADMQFMQHLVPETVYSEQPPAVELAPQGTRLETIIDRGFLRVCYRQDDIPFSYMNSSGELVGLDIELLHHLAYDMKVKLELVPSSWANINKHLNEGYCDIATGQSMTPEGALYGAYSAPIMYRVFAALVKDHRRSEFATREGIMNMEAPRFAIQPLDYYVQILSRAVPQAQVETIESPRDFINRPDGELDAMFLSAEKAAAWSLLYPEYTVVVPTPRTVKIPAAFPLPYNEESLADYLKIWLDLKKQAGTIQQLYDYWVLGKQPEQQKQHRWSVIRDVLHWVE